MPNEWDVIVVGGGVVGLSTAYALTKMGAKRILVLERRIAGAGTSGRGTGAVQVHRFSRTDAALVMRSRAVMQEVSEQVGPAFTYYEEGRLTFAGADGATDLRDSVELAREYGLDVEILDDARAAELVPGMDLSDVALTTYSPLDGRVFSNTLVTSLAGIVRDRGVLVWEGVEVNDIEVDGSGRVTGVRVGHGATTTLRSRHVVIAAGAWTRNVLCSFGAQFPTRKRIARTATVIVQDSAGCSPVPTFLDAVHSLTYIPRSPGLMQIGGHKPGVVVDPANDLTQTDESLAGGELLAGFDEMFDSMRNRFPGWTFGPIVGGWSGLVDVSPDGQPLIGAYPGLDGLWINDTAGYGVMRGPAAGEAIAALLSGEEPTTDLTAWRLERLTSLEPPTSSVQTSSMFRGIATVEPTFNSLAS